jgi:ABC-type dipeptide/oligopeptide/nickel transport system permease subunit
LLFICLHCLNDLAHVSRVARSQIAGYCGGRLDRIAARAIDLMLSLPWIFRLIAARALLPLNVSPLPLP